MSARVCLGPISRTLDRGLRSTVGGPGALKVRAVAPDRPSRLGCQAKDGRRSSRRCVGREQRFQIVACGCRGPGATQVRNISVLWHGIVRGCSVGRGEGHGLTGDSDSRTAVHRGRTLRSLIRNECSARPSQASEEAGNQRLGRGEGYIKTMRKIQIIGIAFAAIFAFSMVSASGASAFTLWDECMETTGGAFTNSDCNVTGSPNLWEFLEIVTLTNVLSLVTDLILLSLGVVNVAVLCEGSMHGSVGLNGESQITELLNLAGEVISLTNLVACTELENENCPEPLATPVNLPWKDQLVNAGGGDAAGDLLGPEGTGGRPGWFVECMGNGQTNECTTEDTILLVENLLAELEVHLIFPSEADTEYLPLAGCSNALSTNGFVDGEVLIYIPNTANENEPARALQAM
jgi:hypothetical protein